MKPQDRAARGLFGNLAAGVALLWSVGALAAGASAGAAPAITHAAAPTGAATADLAAPTPGTAPSASASPGTGTGGAVRQERLSHGRFKDFVVMRPPGVPTGFVVWLSGAQGWAPSDEAMTHALVARGALVAGLATPSVLDMLRKDADKCASAEGDFDNLAHVLQARYALPTYHPPVLAGQGEGASFAYATAVTAPAGVFAGLLTHGHCPHLPMPKPLCKGEGETFRRAAAPKVGLDLLPWPALGTPWVALQSPASACNSAGFVTGMPAARAVALPEARVEVAGAALAAAYASLAARPSTQAIAPPPKDLAGLPLIELPSAAAAAATRDTLVVLLSGDGGWAGIDKEMAAAMVADGVPVVGWDSLRYFWTERAPETLAADLDRVIRYYTHQWGKRRVVLVGFSMGADVLPFAINRLPAATRQRVDLSALLSIGQRADFEFKVTNWVKTSTSGKPTAPEVAKLDGKRTLCVYGLDDKGTLCRKLAPESMLIEALPGSHHFNGDNAGLARLILRHAAAVARP